jgi:hypothetical protein
MSELNTKRTKAAISRLSSLAVMLAVLLTLGASGRAVEPVRGKTSWYSVAAPTVAATVKAPALPPANKFEISLYHLVSGQSEQDSVRFTKQLFTALEERNGRVSEVDPSNADIMKTLADGMSKNSFSDIVGVDEIFDEDRMVLKLTVYSIPERSHEKLHKAKIFEEPHKCNPSRCTRDGCRKILIGEIVEELAGLDKDHKDTK